MKGVQYHSFDIDWAKMEFETKRQKKTKETKQRIMEVAIKLLSDYDINHLTVKNICKLANISNGTFFHYFETKESLISEYMHMVYQEYSETNKPIIDNDDFISAVIDLHVHNIQFTKTIGVDFVRSYYLMTNPLLNNRRDMYSEEYSKLIMYILNNASYKGYINEGLDLLEVGANICMVAKGVIFEWGICGDTFDVEHYIKVMLELYLDTIASKTYLEKYQ